MARRILNRKEMRADYDAAERRKQDDEDLDEVEDEDEGDEDEEEEESDEAEEEAGEEDEEEEKEEKPVKKKKAAPKAPKAPKATKAKTRTRSHKTIRMRLIWGVFNNSHQMVASYEYPKRKDADAHAARLTTEKKSTHFVQPVKEPIEEKKE